MSKIWYDIPNNRPYEMINGVLSITSKDYLPMLDVVQHCIDLFHDEVEWEGMWDISEAIRRFQQGHELFIWYGPGGKLIGYFWIDDSYIYNVFIHSSRPEGQSVKFLQTAFNFLYPDNFTLYCDDWNIRAQKFFEKLGGLKKNS